MSRDGYPVPGTRHRTEDVIQRSRFTTSLAHAADPAAARAFIDEIRAEFPDATHNCWAFVCGAPGSTAQIGMSDAGEPHGTAGRPMLDVLLHSGVGEVVAVVTRYYCGTNLGKGGLVRAYGGCVQRALGSLPLSARVIRDVITLTLGYNDVDAVKRLLEQFDVEILDQSFGADVRFTCSVPAAARAELEHALTEATAGRVKELRS